MCCKSKYPNCDLINEERIRSKYDIKKNNSITMMIEEEESGGARPTTGSGEGERVRRMMGELGNQIKEVGSGWDPERGTRDEGEPIGSRLLDNDTVDQVVKLLQSQGLEFTVG